MTLWMRCDVQPLRFDMSIRYGTQCDDEEASVATNIDIIQDWHEAVNNADTDRLAALVTSGVEIAGPRGTTQGIDALVDWIDRARIQMVPLVWYQRGDTLVVCQHAAWPTESGEMGEAQKVVTVFHLRDGLICSIARYSNAPEALSVAGLSEADRVELRSAAPVAHEVGG